MHVTERKIIFTNRKFVTKYVKTEFCKNVKFGPASLTLQYDSCFNASLSKPVLITLWKVLCQIGHISIKS